MMPVTMRQGPIVFAHRGGGEEAPENTMSAFAYAYEAGIRHVRPTPTSPPTAQSSCATTRQWTAATTASARSLR